MVYTEEIIIVICFLAFVHTLRTYLFEYIFLVLMNTKDYLSQQIISRLINITQSIVYLLTNHAIFYIVSFFFNVNVYKKLRKAIRVLKLILKSYFRLKIRKWLKRNTKSFKNQYSYNKQRSSLNLSRGLRKKLRKITNVSKGSLAFYSNRWLKFYTSVNRQLLM